MDKDFEGKVAVVTGAGSGIGEAIALMLAERGAKVGLAGIVPADLDNVREAIRRAGGEAIAIAGDVASEDFADECIAKTEEAFGQLYCAANCAGVSAAFLELHEYSYSEYRRVMSINLDGIFLGMRAQIKAMLRGGGGSIVNIGSVNGHNTALQRGSPYSSSKYGVEGISRAAAIDYAERGIRVNCVLPGSTDTPMTRVAGDAALAFIDTIPMKRMAAPREIAAPACFALSDLASYMTGSVLIADGGYLSRPW